MSEGSPSPERRRHRRMKVKASAFILRAGKFHGSYHVENISAGGLMLVGRAPLPEGEDVEVMLQLPGYPSFRLQARSVHCKGPSPFEYTMGMAFYPDTAGVAKTIEEVIIPELERLPENQE